LKHAISTDCTISSTPSTLSTISSTETFSSSRENPTISLKIPKATGSFLYSVFQKSPSYVIFLKRCAARVSRFVVSSTGLTSSMTIDIAITFFFSFFFEASLAA